MMFNSFVRYSYICTLKTIVNFFIVTIPIIYKKF